MATLLLSMIFMLIMLTTAQNLSVNITYVQWAVEKGAVCLDGSPPAYYMHRGHGTGANNWLVHVEGGGWCYSVSDCLIRKHHKSGSTNITVVPFVFSGILSNWSSLNPDFHNWNCVKVRYCDGSSFTGDVEEVDPVTKIYYRGARVFSAVVEDLLQKGMVAAENAILSGGSAGGLTSILHCDKFKGFLPPTTKLKCFADGGFFINMKDILGRPTFEGYYDNIVTLHGSGKNLPSSCTSKMKPSLCFFPENMAHDIKTPLFITNSAYDPWQINYILVPFSADRNGFWTNCTANIANCNDDQLKVLQGYRSGFIKALTGLGPSDSRGYFINSCYTHDQFEMQKTWFGSDAPKIDNITIAEAVGNTEDLSHVTRLVTIYCGNTEDYQRLPYRCYSMHK